MTGAPFRTVGCIGEVMIELIAGAGSSAQFNVAGDTYNTAVYLKRSAPELQVDYVTVLGNDRFSDRILAHMASNGIGTSAVARHETRMPGLYAIETDDTGERSFAYWRSASAARMIFEEDGRDPLATLAAYDLVLLSGISLAILSQDQRDRLGSAIDAYRANGGLVAFDSNYRPHLWPDAETARSETEAFWRRTDIAMPSIDDEMALFGGDEAGILDRFRGYGLRQGALKCAAAGPVGLSQTNPRPDVPAAKTVVDTTAAGDSFNAGFLAALAEAQSDEAAMIAGHKLAVQVIGKPGAIVDLDPE